MIPTEVKDELDNMSEYYKKYNSHLLGDYVELELQEKRIVAENDSFIVVVPYWALWPFETLLISKTHLKSIQEFNDKQKLDLAAILKILTTKYDNLSLHSLWVFIKLHLNVLMNKMNVHGSICILPSIVTFSYCQKILCGI